MVALAQRELGVKLPEDFLRLLRIQNGGAVADMWSECESAPNYYADDHVPFNCLMGVGPAGGVDGATTVLDTPYFVQEWGLPSPVVLLDGDGHYWVALDYRECGPDCEPSVVWIDNEMDHELQLAPTFHAFVEKLRPAEHLR